MTRHEEIVEALMGIRVAHQAALGPDRFELCVTARDELVRIYLVARVPDEPITAEIERQVQCDCQLDHAKVTGEMSRTNAQDSDQLIAHLLRERLELFIAELLQVRWRRYACQKLTHS